MDLTPLILDEEDAPVFKLRGRQPEWLHRIKEDLKKACRVLVVAPGGVGKCLGRGTPVMLFDGRIKPAEEVRVGDLLMGPDSLPRIVRSTCHGIEMLYRVSPVKGNSYVVNESHILSLKATCGENDLLHHGNHYPHGAVINVSVLDFIAERKAFHHSTVGWRSAVDFPQTILHSKMPPYMLGLWLGDGNVEKFSISKPDIEVYNSVKEYADSIGHFVVTQISKSGGGVCPTHNIVSRLGKGCGRGIKSNVAKNALEDLGVLNNKHIPHAYKTGSRDCRLQILAGVLDADGHLSNGCIDYISVSRRLCEDVMFVARSVGLSAYLKPCKKGCQNGFVGDYFRLSISGDCDKIPFKIPRRKPAPRKQIKNVLVTGIKVNPIGKGDYFGFTIDGPDRLFLLGDFTVTHNTTLFGALAYDLWRDHKIRTLVLENRDRLTEQTADRLRAETGLEVDVEKGDQRASPNAPIVIGCVQSLSKINRLTGFSDRHFGCVVVDECHLALSPSWLRVIFYFHYGAASLVEGWVRPKDGEYRPQCSVVGFTASPNLGDKRSLGTLFHHTSVNYSFLTAIEEGWLVGIKEVNVPVRIDTRKFRVKKTSEGNAFSVADQNTAYTPEVIQKLAEQYVHYASERKGMIFVPSVEIAKQLSDALNKAGLQSVFVSGECIDKNAKTDWFAAAGPGSVLVNCTIYTFGVDFHDVSCVAAFGAIISKVKYIQSIYRGTRVLTGVLKDGMTLEERLAAIAASEKDFLLVLSPFFISDKIDICEPFDLFADKPPKGKKVNPLTDFTEPAKIRDYIAALEKAADKHAHKQSRTIDPVKFSLSIGDTALAHYEPETSQDAAPPTRDELNWLLAHDISSVDIKNSGQAQKLISRIRERETLGLATPKQLDFLRSLTKEENGQRVPLYNEDWLVTLKKGQAGAITGRQTARWR